MVHHSSGLRALGSLAVVNGRPTRRCTRRGAARWPGTEVAYFLASCMASRQLQFAPAEAIVGRGNCSAALPLAREGAATGERQMPLGRPTTALEISRHRVYFVYT